MSNSVAIPNSKDHRQGESHEHVPNSYQLSDFFGQPRWPVRADERLGVETFDDYQVSFLDVSQILCIYFFF